MINKQINKVKSLINSYAKKIELHKSLAIDAIKRHQLAGNQISYICHDPNVPEDLLAYINETYSGEVVAYSEYINLYAANTIAYIADSIENEFTPSQMDDMGFDQEDLNKLQDIAKNFQYIDIEGF